MKKSLLFILLAAGLALAGCEGQTNDFVGVILKDSPKDYNPNGCGYCFTSESGKYNCSLLSDVNTNMPTQKNLESYIGKRVRINGQEHAGAVNTMCPVSIDLESVELIK